MANSKIMTYADCFKVNPFSKSDKSTQTSEPEFLRNAYLIHDDNCFCVCYSWYGTRGFDFSEDCSFKDPEYRIMFVYPPIFGNHWEDKISNLRHEYHQDLIVFHGYNSERLCSLRICKRSTRFIYGGRAIGCEANQILHDERTYSFRHVENVPTTYSCYVNDYLFEHLPRFCNQTYYIPELLHLLLQAGDVESNPGPCFSRPVELQVNPLAQVGIDVNIPQLVKITEILDRLNDTFSAFAKPNVLDLMKARMSALLTAIWNIIRWTLSKLSTTDLVANLIGSFSTLFPSQKIAQIYSSIFSNVQAQSGLNISAPTAIKAVFVCIFLAITSYLPGKHTIDEFIGRVKNIPQSLKSISMFYEMVDPIAQECVSLVEEHVLGLDTSASRIKTIEEVTKFSERVAELTELHKRRAINKDPALAKEAGRLHYDAVRLLGKCVNMNYDRKSIEFLRSLLPTTYKLSESALSSGADMNKIRRKPIVVWLAGQSQIGKTTLIMKLIQDVEKHSSTYFKENGELPDDWQKEIFTCCPENEYMDGYHGQNWVTIDEFNQQRDSIANPSAENFILLRAISQFPYLLHMAALYEKPNSYLSSHGFVLTSNSTHIQPESIKTKEAITNRISCPYRMEVKEEYRLYYDSNRKYKLDVGKVIREFGGYTPEVYYFTEFDPLTEEDLPGFYTYNQFLYRIIDSYDKESDSFRSYGDYLDNNRKSQLPPRDNSTMYTPPTSSLDSSSDDDNNRPSRPPRKNDYLKEWKKPYAPSGPRWNGVSPNAALHEKILKRAQSGDEDDDFRDCESYNPQDYVQSPWYLAPYDITRYLFCAPIVAFEEVCQRKERIARFVPNFIRKITGNVTDEFYLTPPGYVRFYDHSAIQTAELSDQVSAFAQTAFLISDSECSSVARHITSFRTYAINRLKILKETAAFYLPGFMLTVASAGIALAVGMLKWKFVKKQMKWLQPSEDPEFTPKLDEAERCYLNGCNCDDCRDVDMDIYTPKFLFWNVPCKCYVDFCDRQSISDQQRFVSILSQSTDPVHIRHPVARVQMATFAQRCICSECPLCQGEVCLCKGIARARGVEVGDDDLADRAGRYRIMRERLEAFNQRSLQSPKETPNHSKVVIRTQSPKETPNHPKISIRTQSPKEIPNQPKTLIRTQSPKEVPNKPISYVKVQCNHDGTTLNECYDCQVKRSLQFEAISCNHGTECYCPDQMNEAVETLWKSYPTVKRSELPEFVRYNDASNASQLLFDEFAGMTYVQQKRLIDEMRRTVNEGSLVLQTNRANDLQAQDLIQNRLWPNILRLYVVLPGEDSNAIHRQLGHLLALGGDLFLTNHHFMLVLGLYPDADVVIRQGTIIWKRMKSREFTRSYVRIESKDAVILKLDYKGNAFAKIYHHFISKRVAFSHETQSVTLARYTLTKNCQMYPNPITCANARLASERINIDIDSRVKEIIVQPISWEYQVHTSPGDCGAPLILLNSRIPSKILGIHNAYADSIGVAYAVPLYSEEIQKVVESFGVKSQYGWADLLPIDEPSLLTLNDGENFRVVSVIKGSLPQPTKTKLRPSPLFGYLTQTKTKPGYLRPFRNEKDEMIDPTLLSRKKWGYHLPTLDQTKVEMCDNAISQLFCMESAKDVHEYRIPLTTEQAIIGIEGIEGLPSMNKQSSPGYPFIFSKPPGKGKTGYFGQYEWRLDTPEARIILDAIEDMEKKILDGNRPFVVSIDTLKDARIPIEKANAGKTRIFSAEPVDYCALHRKYFLPFNAHVMANRLYNCSAPGINATSPEFNQLATLLRSKGNKVIAADYAQFDGRIPTEAILSYYRAACDWYKINWSHVVASGRNVVAGRNLDYPEFRLFLERIALECVNHVHVCEKQNECGERFLVFYVVMNGQPSGNPGTAESNTAAGIWIVMYCWLTDVTPVMNVYLDVFFSEVYICTYGDDMIMNVSDRVVNIFNQHTLTKSMMRNFMLECTDEQKTGGDIPPFRSLSEVTFLKRSFKWNSDIHMYVGALPVDLLFDITNWVRSGAQDPYVITVDNLVSVASELSLHGYSEFQARIPKIREAYRKIAQRSGKFVVFDSYWSYIFKYRDGDQFTQAFV